MSNESRRYELKARAERQQATRNRIVDATVALHQEVGPARTTVSEIARRAGVQRLTVYNHFPQEQELFAACQQRFLTDHPLPNLGELLAAADPVARVEAVLSALYASYREREPMTSKVLRDRSLVPDLDALLRQTMDAQLDELSRALVLGFKTRGSRTRRVAALIGLALEFSTWSRLKDEGLDDPESAALMAELVRCALG